MIASHSRDAMRELARRSSDPAVHRVVHEYVEGRSTRQELFRDPSAVRALSAWYRDEISRANDAGFRPQMMADLIATEQWAERDDEAE